MLKRIINKTILIIVTTLLALGLSLRYFESSNNHGENQIQQTTILGAEESTVNPIIPGSVNWYSDSSNSGYVSITYSESIAESIGFHPRENQGQVILLWDDEGDGFTVNDSYEVNGGWNPGKFKWVVSYDEEVDGYDTVVYEFYGLKGNTLYENFGLYINVDGSAWNVGDYSNTSISTNGDIALSDPLLSDNSGLESNDDYFYEITLSPGFKTHHNLIFYYLIIIALLVVIGIIVLTVFIIKWLVWWNKNMTLAMYFNGGMSFQSGELIIDLLRANKVPEIWENIELEDLELFAAGRRLDAVFKRDDEINNGYRVYITESTNSKRVVLAILSASRYNEFYVGIKSKTEKHHVHILSDSRAEKLVKLVSKNSMLDDGKNREEVLKEILEKTANIDTTTAKGNNSVLSSFSEPKSTSTKLRYKLLFPSNHAELERMKDKEYINKNSKFFYTFNGKLYPFEAVFKSRNGNLFEFDLINLQPGTIYTGIAASPNGGKIIFPTTAIYGITKNEDGTLPTKTEAKLGRPEDEDSLSYPFWDHDIAIQMHSEELMERIYSIITKKHVEYDDEDAFIHTGTAHEYYDDYIYKWIEESKEIRKKIQEGYDMDRFIPDNESK